MSVAEVQILDRLPNASRYATVTVLVPVLNRPKRVSPLVDSLISSARFISLDLLFLCSPGDDEQRAAIRRVQGAHGPTCRVNALEIDDPPGRGDYAKKINAGFRNTATEFIFMGADDLVFHPGWIERALACHMETKACVVGTNDNGNRAVMQGEHSTHTLVHRDYGECGIIDNPDCGVPLYEGYDHNFVDTEFIQTAMARETWASAGDSIVEHLHPIWGKAENDETYKKGQLKFGTDRKLYESRRPLWEQA